MKTASLLLALAAVGFGLHRLMYPPNYVPAKRMEMPVLRRFVEETYCLDGWTKDKEKPTCWRELGK